MQKFFAVVDDIESLISLFQPKRVSGFPRWLSGKEPACSTGDTSVMPGKEWSPGEENGNPLQYSCLGNTGQRSLAGCSPWDHKRVRHDLLTKEKWSISRILALPVLSHHESCATTSSNSTNRIRDTFSLSLFSLAFSDVKLFGMDSTYFFFMTSPVQITIYTGWYICSPHFIPKLPLKLEILKINFLTPWLHLYIIFYINMSSFEISWFNIYINQRQKKEMIYIFLKVFKEIINVSIPKMLHWNFSVNFNKNGASLVAQRLKRLPAMQETWVWPLGREDPLEKDMASHSSILAWRIPWRDEPGRLQSMGSQTVGHNWAISLSFI